MAKKAQKANVKHRKIGSFGRRASGGLYGGSALFLFKQLFLYFARAPFFLPADFGDLFLFLALGGKELAFHFFAEIAAGIVAIQLAGALPLALDFHAGGEVFQIDAGRAFVDFLPALAGAENEFFEEILFADAAPFQAGAKLFQFFF